MVLRYSDTEGAQQRWRDHQDILSTRQSFLVLEAHTLEGLDLVETFLFPPLTRLDLTEI